MVRSKVLLFFSFFYSGNVVLGNYIPRYLDEYSSNSLSYSMKASAEASAPRSVVYHQSSGTEKPLKLNLAESAIMQIVNHGPSDINIIIYDYDVQIGETSLDSYPLNITLDGAQNATRLNMELLSLDSGKHLLYLIPRHKNGSHLVTQVNADVRLLPRSQSRMVKRWNINQDPSQSVNETDYNAVVEWSIDPDDDSNGIDYYFDEEGTSGGQYKGDDEDEDEGEDEDEDEDENEYTGDKNDGDDDNDDDEDDEDDVERFWKWNNKAGWKSGHKHKSHKQEKVVKVIISQSDCPITTPSTSITDSHTTSSTLPSVSFTSISSSSRSNPSSSTSLTRKTSSTPISSRPTSAPDFTPTFTPSSLSTSSTSTSTPTPTPTPTPTSSSDIEEPESTPEHIIIRTETIEGAEVTVIEGRNITVVDPHEITVLVGRATTTTERETVIANTITFNVETITKPGQTLTQAGATETISGATVTVAGPPATFVALTATVTGPGKVVTKFILQQTTKTTIMTQVNDFVTVTQTQYNPVYETVYGSTSTTTENVVVTVVRTQTPT